jgi:hypothetical protein
MDPPVKCLVVSWELAGRSSMTTCGQKVRGRRTFSGVGAPEWSNHAGDKVIVAQRLGFWSSAPKANLFHVSHDEPVDWRKQDAAFRLVRARGPGCICAYVDNYGVTPLG